MNSIRIRFTRCDKVKYISHLDLMRAFERALRRSGVPVAYSQGFNPHPRVVFGLPLSVGVTSEAEYADIELDRHMQPSAFMEALNGQLPEGLRILKAEKKETKDNIMATVVQASYKILACVGDKAGIGELTRRAEKFMSNNVLNVKRQSKRGVKDVDIRPMIQEFNVMSIENLPLDPGENERLYCFTALLSAGSSANLKPELLIQAFSETAEIGVCIKTIHRTGLFVDKGGRPADPLEDDVLLC